MTEQAQVSAQVRESRNLRAESSASLANLAVVAFALLDVHIAAKHAVKESRELRRWIDDLGDGPVLRVQGQEIRREPLSVWVGDALKATRAPTCRLTWRPSPTLPEHRLHRPASWLPLRAPDEAFNPQA